MLIMLQSSFCIVVNNAREIPLTPYFVDTRLSFQNKLSIEIEIEGDWINYYWESNWNLLYLLGLVDFHV